MFNFIGIILYPVLAKLHQKYHKNDVDDQLKDEDKEQMRKIEKARNAIAQKK